MKTDATDSPHDSLETIREAFIERMWLFMGIYAALVIPLILWRSAVLGGTIRIIPIIIVGLLAIAAALLRRKMAPWLRAMLPLGLLVAGGLGGLATTGLQGNGVSVLIFGCICTLTLYPTRVGAAIFTMCWLGAAAIGAMYVSGVIHLPYGIEFASNPMVWTGSLLTTLMLTAFVCSALAAYQKSTSVMLRQMELQRDQIDALANHDALTGLPSLRLARDRLDVACSVAKRAGTRVALLFVDLDDFKMANDNYGHEAGDVVLCAVAERLSLVLRASDTAARIGGDEFMVVLPGIGSDDAAARTAEKIIEALAVPIPFEGVLIGVGASIGIALFPDDGQSGEALLRHSDHAMYRVKKAGKNGYAMFERRPPSAQ
ncbi:MAG: GGDEF domain-containing protein [Pseudomonadota bacterium]